MYPEFYPEFTPKNRSMRSLTPKKPKKHDSSIGCMRNKLNGVRVNLFDEHNICSTPQITKKPNAPGGPLKRKRVKSFDFGSIQINLFGEQNDDCFTPITENNHQVPGKPVKKANHIVREGLECVKKRLFF